MNIMIGDRVEWDAPIFKGGSFFRGRCRGARFVGTARLAGVVERESYGRTGQHTFSIRLDDGSLKLVKGRNLYGNIVRHEPAPHTPEEIAAKRDRSERARLRREERVCERT